MTKLNNCLLPPSALTLSMGPLIERHVIELAIQNVVGQRLASIAAVVRGRSISA